MGNLCASHVRTKPLDVLINMGLKCTCDVFVGDVLVLSFSSGWLRCGPCSQGAGTPHSPPGGVTRAELRRLRGTCYQWVYDGSFQIGASIV